MPVPAVRVRAVNDLQARPTGSYVLYWMTAFRRLTSNFALQRTVDQARAWNRPLVILEALRCDYRWASDRMHRFVIDGMAEHAKALRQSPVRYLPYVEPERGAGKGLLARLAAHACLVVTDDFPAFFLPRMVAAAGRRIDGVLTHRATCVHIHAADRSLGRRGCDHGRADGCSRHASAIHRSTHVPIRRRPFAS